MIVIKSICALWFFLATISEIHSSEYLHFGSSEEEPRQAEYYLSADSGVNAGPTDELIRTQRSFWNLFKNNDLFGECGNCCNNCNYNLGNKDNIDSRPPLILPLQPWRPLPLWRPLEPLFGRANCGNCGTGGNSNNYGSPSGYGMNRCNDNATNNPPSYDNTAPPAPETVYETPIEVPPAEPDYQVDNSTVTEDTFKPASKPVVTENSYNIPEQSSDGTPKELQHSNGNEPKIIYQPIIYVSPQYQGSNALNQVKQHEEGYDEERKENEKAQLPNSEALSDETSKHSSYTSNGDITKSNDSLNNTPETTAVITPSRQITATYTGSNLNNPPTNPSVPTVSTFYNIITPPLINSPTAGQIPYTARIVTSNAPCSNGNPSKYSLYPSNYIPLDNYPLAVPATVDTLPPPPTPPIVTPTVAVRPPPSAYTYLQPIQLTSDDQPYRVCPELFREYLRKLNTFLPHIHGNEESSFVNHPRTIHY